MGKHKTKTGKLPKRIAGVKLPKELRKSGERLIAEVDTPANRELLATGLAAVAAAVAKSAAAPHAAGQAAEGGTRPSDPVGKAVGMAATALLAGWLAKRTRSGDTPPNGDASAC